MRLLLSILPLALLAQHPAPRLSRTDDRITALVSRLKVTPIDAALQVDLAGAYLQKMRETADGSYLERASRLVEVTLKQQPQNYDARRRSLEIDLMLHRFAGVITGGRKLLAERANDFVVLGLVGDAQMERGDYDAA